MKIKILNSDNTLAYLVRSCLLSGEFDDIDVVNSVDTNCDLFIAHRKDLKKSQLDKTKMLLVGEDIKRPFRHRQVRNAVRSFGYGNKLIEEPEKIVKKKKKEENFAEALEKSKEMVRKKEAKKLEKARRATKGKH